MDELVKIIECPRDAWQGLPANIPTEIKVEYLRRAMAAGFTHIDAVSFVSPAAVPQMADSEKVLEFLKPFELLMPSENVEIIGIVVNAKGAERAVKTGAVHTLGFPYSISPQFLLRNQNQTPEESLDVLEEIGATAYKSGLDVVAYLSMAFGNPYGDPWSIDEVVDACDLLVDSGVRQISLADTVGLATPAQISQTLTAVFAAHDEIEIGVHLHARPDAAPARIRAAYEAGCRRFDGAVGGLGGCPFAQDALVGNIATETLISTLRECGAQLPSIALLDDLMQMSRGIATTYGTRTT
jgi:hydroxymethylglutaryl-CoA lyase